MKLPEAKTQMMTERRIDRTRIPPRNSLNIYEKPISSVLAPSSDRKQVGGKIQSRPSSSSGARAGTTESAVKWSRISSTERFVGLSSKKLDGKRDETFSVKKLPKQGLGSKMINSDVKRPKINDKTDRFTQHLLDEKDLEIMTLKKELASMMAKSSQLLSSKFEVETKNSTLEEELELQDIGIAALKENVVKLKSEIYDHKINAESKDTELAKLNLDKLKINTVLERFIPAAQGDIDHKLETWMEEKSNEVISLKEETLNLTNAVKKLESELVNKNVEADECKEFVSHHSSQDDVLEKETALFIEKISSICRNKSRKIKASSKDENVKINLKITARKGNLDRDHPRLSFCGAESPGTFLKTPCQTFSVKEDIDSVLQEKVRKVNVCGEEGDNIQEPVSRKGAVTSPGEAFFPDGSPFGGMENLNVNLNEDCRASLGTIGRAEDLDMKLQELWTRMSCQEETLEQLKSEKRRFTFSVDLLEEELTESRTQHMNLVEQVNIVKKLFN